MNPCDDYEPEEGEGDPCANCGNSCFDHRHTDPIVASIMDYVEDLIPDDRGEPN